MGHADDPAFHKPAAVRFPLGVVLQQLNHVSRLIDSVVDAKLVKFASGPDLTKEL